MRPRWNVGVLIVCAALGCGNGETQTSTIAAEREGASEEAPSVAQEALDRWIENAEGVEGYTIIFEVDGRERTETHVKRMVDGVPVFVPEGTGRAPRDVMAGLARLLDRGRHDGTDEVRGEVTDVLVIDDAAALRETFAAAAAGFRPTRLEIQVGREDRLMRQITMIGEASMPTGERSQVINTVRFDDWRTVDGFAYPFRTTSQTEGLGEISGPGAAEEIEAMEELERALERMPESQREIAREAMKGRIEAARRPAAGGGFDVVVVVKELRIRR